MIYKFNDEKTLIDIVPGDVVADSIHETLVTPEQGLYEPIKFDNIKQKWFGLTEDEYYRDKITLRPLTAQDDINAHLFKMSLDLQKQLEEMRHVG